MNQKLARVVSVREVMTGVYLLKVDASDMASEAHPGQFIMVGCDSSYGRLLRRPISIHRAEDGILSFLFAVVGTGTEWLAQRQPGELIDLLGPVGNGFTVLPKSRNLLLVAGGMGIAPLCFLAQEALKKNCTVKLIAGAKTAYQICPSEFLPAGMGIVAATEDGTAGEKGLVTSLLPGYTEWADQVFACGPVPMYRAMANEYGTMFKDKPFQVSLEVRMGCGMGFCYACTINTRQGLKQACKDGPVFNLNDVLWEEFK